MISNIQSKQNMEKALNDRTGTFQALDDREHEGDTSCVTLGYTKLTCSISLETWEGQEAPRSADKENRSEKPNNLPEMAP